ncbi:MAG TPA: phosphopyruvate hydratase [Candidatus Paceibacterota bacterium]|nr:phosphopyruvate hydratase [Candidatus Paceibacterota bacterium]HQI25726.1 phosphopyruvate hydratase [Candidatus Paceibacterota bacterium]
MSVIKKINAREILDSRGNPTVETDLWLTDGSFGRAAVPSGASTGQYEAKELRDGDDARYGGLGVLRAVKNINDEIAVKMVNEDLSQADLDTRLIELDGTTDKSRLGANAILAVSLALAKATAQSRSQELFEYLAELSGTEKMILPVPMINILNGGRHASGGADFQEFMIVPVGAPTFGEALHFGAKTFQTLKKILLARNLPTTVGDEGGFAPKLTKNAAGLDLLLEAIEKAGFRPGQDIALSLDVAASEFYENGQYELRSEQRTLTSEELIAHYQELTQTYPLISIEDGLAEEDWSGFKQLTETLGDKVQLVGDDLFVTNPARLKQGVEQKAANAILIKPNQIGTLTETLETIKLAKGAGYRTIISHRSGETEDTTIADLAVGTAAGQIKSGSLSRGERTAKYNRLLQIAEKLGDQAIYLGQKIFE